MKTEDWRRHCSILWRWRGGGWCWGIDGLSTHSAHKLTKQRREQKRHCWWGVSSNVDAICWPIPAMTCTPAAMYAANYQCSSSVKRLRSACKVRTRDSAPVTSPTAHTARLQSLGDLASCPSASCMASSASSSAFLTFPIIVHRKRHRPRFTAVDTAKPTPSPFGYINRRNAFYNAIPWPILRANTVFNSLEIPGNVTITSKKSLSCLRQDRKPFEYAYNSLPIHAHNIYLLLGFAENNAISKQLERKYRGHVHTLEIWKHIYNTKMVKKHFEPRFRHLHIPNAALLYIHSEEQRWKQMALNDPTAPPRCQPIILYETGLHVHTNSSVPIAASPAALVRRRKKDDFWMWGHVDTVLICDVDSPFTVTSPKRCRVRKEAVGSELSILQWVEAQYTMLCAGERILFANVVRYANDGGICVFCVRRNDHFIVSGLKVIEKFLTFVEDGYPPPASFEKGDAFDQIVEMVFKGVEEMQLLVKIDAEEEERVLKRWKEMMNEWEANRASNLFF